MTKKVTLIMPAFNVGEFIESAIQSIIDQTFSDWLLIIINDGSTDNTWEVISTFTDSRIKAFNFNGNKGPGWASSYALKMIDTPYVGRMDADDLSEPDRLEKQIAYMEKNKDVSAVRTYAHFFSNDQELRKSDFYKMKKNISEPLRNEVLTRQQLSEKMYWYLCFVSPTALMRTDAVKAIGYSSSFRLGEDYHLFYNLNKNNYIIDTLPETLYHYRIVKGSATHRHIKSHSEVNYQIKKIEIGNLFIKHQVYIWGTGSVAQELTSLLEEDGHHISGYLDFNLNADTPLSPRFDFKQLDPALHKVLIAATPVREKIIAELQSRRYKHLKDFIVFR